MTRYLDLLHEIEEKTRQGGTDKTDKKDLVGFVSSPEAHKSMIFSDAGIERAGEYDAAQERGEVAGHGGTGRGNQYAKVPDGNIATTDDIGLSRKEIFEARQLRDPLTPQEETAIRRTLDAIGETDPAEIDAVVEQCEIDDQARSYWLSRAFSLSVRARLVTCGTCRHFTRNPEHPRLGRCAAGGRENPAGNWDTDRRMCGLHQREAT